MRIPSGTTDQVIFFVAVDATDLKTRKTGLSAFTVYRARDTAAAAVYTTPTIAELSSSNMPGVYSLLLDEDMTIASGNDSEEICLHITCANMAPVTRTIELYRRDTTGGNTLLVDANGRCDVIKIAGTTQTARDIGASVLLSSGSGAGQLDFTSGVVKANATQWVGGTIPAVNVTGVPKVDATHLLGTAWATPATAGLTDVNVKQISTDGTAADNAESFFDGTGYAGTNNVIPLVTVTTTATTATNLTNAPTNGDLTAAMKTSVTTAATAATPTAAAVTGAVGSVTGNVGGNVTGSVGSVVGAVGSVTGAVGSVTGNVGGNVVGSVASVVGAVGSVTGLTASDVGAIKTTTDKFVFGVANKVDANIEAVNGTVVNGAGTALSPWGP